MLYILEGFAILMKICDLRLEKRSAEYQNYLIATLEAR